MYHVMHHYREQLQEKALLTSFTQVEMPAVIVLANMELNGFGTPSLHNASCVAVNALQVSACMSSTVVLSSEIDFEQDFSCIDDVFIVFFRFQRRRV